MQVAQLEVVAEPEAMANFDAADLQQELDFLLREVIGEFIFGDAVFIQAARFFFFLLHDHVVSQHCQAVRA